MCVCVCVYIKICKRIFIGNIYKRAKAHLFALI